LTIGVGVAEAAKAFIEGYLLNEMP